MDLKKLKDAVALVNAFIAENESSSGSYTKKPLPVNANPAYDACNGMWSAAQSDLNRGKGWPNKDGSLFTIFDYVSGLQWGGQRRAPPKSAEQAQEDIVALGHSERGQEWLSDDSNAALIDPDYQRHFLGYRVVRKHQNDEAQGYNRVE